MTAEGSGKNPETTNNVRSATPNGELAASDDQAIAKKAEAIFAALDHPAKRAPASDVELRVPLAPAGSGEGPVNADIRNLIARLNYIDGRLTGIERSLKHLLEKLDQADTTSPSSRRRRSDRSR